MSETLARARTAALETADFEAWMRGEQRRIYLLCHRFLQDSDAADTATQDVFIKAYGALQKPGAPELDDAGKWLTRIAVNTCLDRLRSRRWQFWRKRARAEDEDIILALTASGNPSAEDQLYAAQIGARLAQALSRLSERQRAVFVLRHYEDHKLEEIATILGLDVGTVKAHLSRAVSRLREELKDLYAGLARLHQTASGQE